MSKGSKRRPSQIDKSKFDDEFDRIFKVRKSTPDHGKTLVHKDKKKEAKRDGKL